MSGSNKPPVNWIERSQERRSEFDVSAKGKTKAHRKKNVWAKGILRDGSASLCQWEKCQGLSKTCFSRTLSAVNGCNAAVLSGLAVNAFKTWEKRGGEEMSGAAKGA